MDLVNVHKFTDLPRCQKEWAVRSPTERRSPVMADVAKAAGVSHQTVSRVLNEHPNVRSRDPHPGPGGDRQARLPPQPRRPRAGHPPHTDVRRGRLQHHAVRPGQHGLRHRAGGQGGRLLREHRRPAHRRHGGHARRDRLPGRPGRRRHRRGRAAALGRPRPRRPARGACPRWSSRAGTRARCRWSASTRSTAPGWPPST